MSQHTEIRAQVTKSKDVLIRATKPTVNLTEPFYAINWFSTKVEFLYHLYNFLASRSVYKIGGEPFFKASVTETILDDTGKGKRDLLLIVKYPGGMQFKSLMESTYFKMVSIFRIMSVHKFTFGFTQKIAADPVSSKADNLHYAIHYFNVQSDSTDLIQKVKEQLPQTVTVKYAGEIIANLMSQQKGKEADQVPNLMSGVIVLQAKEEKELRDLFSSIAYKELLKNSGQNFISLLNRIF